MPSDFDGVRVKSVDKTGRASAKGNTPGAGQVGDVRPNNGGSMGPAGQKGNTKRAPKTPL
jgi:hypothetical protein